MSADNLQDLLLGLEAYGRPTLFRMGDGWYLKISMHATPPGTDFNVSSEFNHATPMEAAICCRDRIEAMIGQLAQVKRIGA